MVRAVFIHLPKTAGTSFREALCRGFGEDAVSPAFIASYLTPQDADRLARYDIICGHISVLDARRFFPEASLLTILRDPIDRCVSWYHYARGQPPIPHADVTAARTMSIDDFFALDESITFRNVFNRQVRQLGDHVLNLQVDMAQALAEARRTLADCVWVGRQESLPQDMQRLARVFPEMAGVGAKALNVTPERPAAQAISAELRRKIVRYNHYDIALCSQVAVQRALPPTP